MTMGEYIRKLRIERGWSQEELGRQVGVNRAAVNKWEIGSVENIKRSTIKRLSEIFGVSPCDLMQWETPSSPSTPEILTLYNSLDAEDQSLALGIVRQMAEQDKYKKYKKELSVG